HYLVLRRWPFFIYFRVDISWSPGHQSQGILGCEPTRTAPGPRQGGHPSQGTTYLFEPDPNPFFSMSSTSFLAPHNDKSLGKCVDPADAADGVQTGTVGVENLQGI